MTSTRSMTAPANTAPADTEALRAELDATRRHLAGTVQELTHQLNVPRRLKESATDAGRRAARVGRSHPRATAAVGGAVALGVGATAWIVGRRK